MNRGGRAILDGLADCLVESAVRVEETAGRTRLWLPQPSSADYRFYIDSENTGGACIAAVPNGAPAGAFFWHLPLDYAPEDQDAALRELVREARRLIQNRSRVIQTGGLVLWRFRCEAEEDVGWRRVGGTIARPRLFFRPPFAFRLKRWEYHSDPPCSVCAAPAP